MTTLNDFKLLQICRVFDINFSAALWKVRSRGYLEKIRAVLPVTPRVDKLFLSIDEYMAHALEG